MHSIYLLISATEMNDAIATEAHGLVVYPQYQQIIAIKMPLLYG